MTIYSDDQIRINSIKIQQDIEAAFPGYVLKSIGLWPDGEWEIIADDEKSLKDFYHLYPNLTKAEADDQIIKDIEAIVRRYLPDTRVTDFDQTTSKGERHVEL